MKNKFHIILSILITFSCKQEKKLTGIKPSDNTKETQTIKSDVKPNDKKLSDYREHTEILIPRDYRDFGTENDANALTKNWLDLYQKNEKYYLEKSKYTISNGYSECSGDSTKIINSKTNAILLIHNKNLKSGEIKFVKFEKNKIWPKEKLTFFFENQEYTIRAEGKSLSTEKISNDSGEEIYHNVENYKLYLSSNNSDETLFLEEKSFNDTFTELLFIGDIDRDGKPDFIFSSNRDYEEERVILYLSSEVEKGKLIKKVAEIAVQFDC